MNSSHPNRHTVALQQILALQEIVVQRVSPEPYGKNQKYRLIDCRHRVPYHFSELTMEKIKMVCVNYFSELNNENIEDMTCDVLATEKGPPCTRIEQIPNPRVILVRFV